MKLILGLGNPGTDYEHTRHNAGFDALDEAAAFFHVRLKKRCLRKYRYASVPGALLVEPLTFMNSSGDIMRFFPEFELNPRDILVVCDNMDLGAGGLRLRAGGGNGGQKGLDSIEKALGSGEFVRLFIGTGRPAEGVSVIDHVLSAETDPQKAAAYGRALEDAALLIRDFIGGKGLAELQSVYNRKGIQ